MITAAAAAGKAIFSEKPIGGTPAQTVEAFKIATKHSTANGVAYKYLWSP
ncbi:MAG: gfo/Idh/MocA family oxidoreductase, partial [Acidimicrobiaceae bacterium]